MSKKMSYHRFLRFYLLFCYIFSHFCGQAQNKQINPQNFRSKELSNLHVVDIAQDKIGYIWIATSRGLNKYNGYEYTHYLRDETDTNSLDNDQVNSLHIAKNGELWVLTRWGLNLYNRRNDNFIRIVENIQFQIYSINDDHNGVLWIGTDNGLAILDRKSNKLKYIDNAGLKIPIHNICFDNDGIMWINSGGKLFIYNPVSNQLFKKTICDELIVKKIVQGYNDYTICCLTDNGMVFVDSRTFKRVNIEPTSGISNDIAFIGYNSNFFFMTSDLKVYSYQKEKNVFDYKTVSDSENANDITSVFMDKYSNIWIGTFNAGCKFYSHFERNFNVDTQLSSYFKNKFVTSITGNDENIWITTSRYGLFQYNIKTCQINNLLPNPQSTKGINAGLEWCYFDSQNRLWVASQTFISLYNVSNGFSLIKTFKKYNSGTRLLEDNKGNLWLATSSDGLLLIPSDSKNLEFSSPHTLPIQSKNVRDVIELKMGGYVFSAYGYGIFTLKDTKSKPQLIKNNDKQSEILSKSVICLYEDSKGMIWMGSYGSGVMRYDPRTKKTATYTMLHGLPSNDVLAIYEDNKNRIWMSTSFGLVKFTYEKGFINYQTKDGLLGNQYHQNSVYFCNRGVLYFSGNHGITSLFPEAIQETTTSLPIVLETLKTNDKTIFLEDEIDIEDRKLKLSHKEKSFTISFFGIDFYSANNLQYSYKLDGYNNNWSYPSSIRQANFSSIPSGHYSFKLKVRDGDGNWIKSTTDIQIIVKPAPWFTWWAITIYVISILALAYFLISTYIKLKLNSARTKIAEENLVKENELNQAKIDFFLNISHELRTPLSLIYGPFIELSKNSFCESDARFMSLIGSNVERLMTLIDQLLNFTHLNIGLLPLSVAEIDIIASVTAKIEKFKKHAHDKDIVIIFSSSFEKYKMLADEDKIDKIFSNLLSNALKFTPTHGKIHVLVELITSSQFKETYAVLDNSLYGKYLKISFSDNGVGVLEDEVDKLFERFYRSKSGIKTSMVSGSGIGLHYTKCLVEKHKGRIKANLNTEGGMTFHFALPLDYEVYNSEERNSMKQHIDTDLDQPHGAIVQQDNLKISATSIEKTVESKPQLLIIEDEPEMQLFLETLFSPYYNIVKAYDGSEGLQIAIDKLPDIILSDVMLPLMNGLEVCDKLKNNRDTCHIPVILLTAKSGIGDQIFGIKSGADVYIPKPFNPEYLISVLHGVLLNRKRIQHLFSVAGSTSDNSKQALVQLSEMDQELLNKLNNKIDEFINYSEIKIDSLAAELNFSRSVFYRKLKSITGLSPNDYLRIYKIQRAAFLIQTGKYSFSEIADMTGFSTHSHFSATFKAHFGVTPSEYKGS